jgi:hypothetical protein
VALIDAPLTVTASDPTAGAGGCVVAGVVGEVVGAVVAAVVGVVVAAVVGVVAAVVGVVVAAVVGVVVAAVVGAAGGVVVARGLVVAVVETTAGGRAVGGGAAGGESSEGDGVDESGAMVVVAAADPGPAVAFAGGGATGAEPTVVVAVGWTVLPDAVESGFLVVSAIEGSVVVVDLVTDTPATAVPRGFDGRLKYTRPPTAVAATNSPMTSRSGSRRSDLGAGRILATGIVSTGAAGGVGRWRGTSMVFSKAAVSDVMSGDGTIAPRLGSGGALAELKSGALVIGSSVAMNSATDGRSAGVPASACPSSARSSAENRSLRSGAGVVVLRSNSAARESCVSRAKGDRASSAWNSDDASEYTSEATEPTSPVSTSGATCSGVYELVVCESARSSARAMPKSASFTAPELAIRMFAGFTSR